MALLSASDFNFGSTPLSYAGPDMASSFAALPSADLAPSMSGAASMAPGPLGMANAALGGLQTIANIWGAFQAQKMAKKQFKFTKDVTNTNLANQIQSYNTALADRARSRGVVEGQTPDQVSQYISANALNRSSGKTGAAPTSGITAAALSNYGDYVRPRG